MNRQNNYLTLEYQDLLRIISGLRSDNHGLQFHHLIMVGGVHGSGKSYICERLAQDIPDMVYLNASSLINHRDALKHVEDIKNNQKQLINRIKDIKDSNAMTLVDGHFCVTDKSGDIIYVGDEIFQVLSPTLLVLVETTSEIIQERILNRDHIEYSLDLIKRLKQNEVFWANHTAHLIGTPLCIING